MKMSGHRWEKLFDFIIIIFGVRYFCCDKKVQHNILTLTFSKYKIQ